MKPVSVSVTVPNSQTEVYEFLDVLANHEPFTNHLLLDWSYAGPMNGAGARARMRIRRPGRADWLELEVVEADPPRRTVEESISAGGRRHTRGTYALDDLSDGGTRITFELAWQQIPLIGRIAEPITRWVVRRANRRSLQRLAARLESVEPKRKSPAGRPSRSIRASASHE